MLPAELEQFLPKEFTQKLDLAVVKLSSISSEIAFVNPSGVLEPNQFISAEENVVETIKDLYTAIDLAYQAVQAATSIYRQKNYDIETLFQYLKVRLASLQARNAFPFDDALPIITAIDSDQEHKAYEDHTKANLAIFGVEPASVGYSSGSYTTCDVEARVINRTHPTSTASFISNIGNILTENEGSFWFESFLANKTISVDSASIDWLADTDYNTGVAFQVEMLFGSDMLISDFVFSDRSPRPLTLLKIEAADVDTNVLYSVWEGRVSVIEPSTNCAVFKSSIRVPLTSATNARRFVLTFVQETPVVRVISPSIINSLENRYWDEVTSGAVTQFEEDSSALWQLSDASGIKNIAANVEKWKKWAEKVSTTLGPEEALLAEDLGKRFSWAVGLLSALSSTEQTDIIQTLDYTYSLGHIAARNTVYTNSSRFITKPLFIDGEIWQAKVQLGLNDNASVTNSEDFYGPDYAGKLEDTILYPTRIIEEEFIVDSILDDVVTLQEASSWIDTTMTCWDKDTPDVVYKVVDVLDEDVTLDRNLTSSPTTLVFHREPQTRHVTAGLLLTDDQLEPIPIFDDCWTKFAPSIPLPVTFPSDPILVTAATTDLFYALCDDNVIYKCDSSGNLEALADIPDDFPAVSILATEDGIYAVNTGGTRTSGGSVTKTVVGVTGSIGGNGRIELESEEDAMLVENSSYCVADPDKPSPRVYRISYRSGVYLYLTTPCKDIAGDWVFYAEITTKPRTDLYFKLHTSPATEDWFLASDGDGFEDIHLLGPHTLRNGLTYYRDALVSSEQYIYYVAKLTNPDYCDTYHIMRGEYSTDGGTPAFQFAVISENGIPDLFGENPLQDFAVVRNEDYEPAGTPFPVGEELYLATKRFVWKYFEDELSWYSVFDYKDRVDGNAIIEKISAAQRDLFPVVFVAVSDGSIYECYEEATSDKQYES
jgi:hypothetical protein